MSWALRTLTGACAALTLAACSSSDGGVGTSETVVVPWRDYAPSLQAKIDAMALAKDCDGMQVDFNRIGATNLAMRNRFGHGNVEVLQYIDDKEREANCFPLTVDSTSSHVGWFARGTRWREGAQSSWLQP